MADAQVGIAMKAEAEHGGSEGALKEDEREDGPDAEGAGAGTAAGSGQQ